MSEKQMKTLGQVAHEKGEEIGSWKRRWIDMSSDQKEEWEQIARAVVREHYLRMFQGVKEEWKV